MRRLVGSCVISLRIRMKVFYKTHAGLVREKNEDALLIRHPKLFAVADGMGGRQGGEVASRMALDIFGTKLEGYLKEKESPPYALRKAVSDANAAIYKCGHDKAEYNGMGTTLTAVYFENKTVIHVVQIGDSKLYRYRDGKLQQLTFDQTLVAELLARGKITKEEAGIHPQRNMLLQALGTESIVQAEISRFEIKEKDKLLLCSDGLSNMVTDEDMIKILDNKLHDDCVASLINLALQNGGKDNISVILLEDLGKEDGNGKDN